MKSRNTKQKEILNNEIKKFNSFFTAEDLFKHAAKKDKSLGIATVYRFLKEQTKNKKLNSYLCGRKTIYSSENKSHCHFICEKTGKVIHFDLDNLDFLKKVRDKIPGEINSFQLEIKGICKDCNSK